MRKGWEYKKLGKVCEVINGLWIGKKEPFINVAVIRNTNFSKDCQLNLDKVAFIDVEVKQFASKKLKFGDIIIEKSGGSEKQPVGRPILFNISDGNYSFSNFTSTLRIKDNTEVNSAYLHKCLYAFYLKGETFKLQSKTTGLHNLNMKGYLRLNIPLPPKSTQLAIVSELDKINELIRLKKEQLKDFDNLAQSLFYEMFGDPVENEKGWEVKKLGDICTDITDGDHMPPPKSEFGIPFITISDIDKDTRCLNFENTFYVPEDYYNNLKENRKPQKDDLLYTVTGSYGIPVIVNTDKKFCFQRHIALLRPNKEILSTIFLCYWVLSDGVKFMADKVATGIAQKTVGLNSIRKFSCILPPLSLQHLFAQRVEQIEREKSEVQKSIQNLETLLASRMQYWFE